MHKKILASILICSLFLCSIFFELQSVFALEHDELYTNQNGISVSFKELQFINEFYGEDFFDNMTEIDYEWIQDLNIDDSEVTINTYYDFPITPFSTIHVTPNKKLSIASSCTSICTIVTVATWISNPAVRSYDLIGARFNGTSLASSNFTTKVVSSIGTQYFSNNKVYGNGLGTAVKLPDSATNIRIEQKFYANTGGTIYASYQHAISNVTLQVSQEYYLHYSGAGSVFRFTGNAIGKYDQMSGVDIVV